MEYDNLEINFVCLFLWLLISSGIVVVDGGWSCAGRKHDVGDIELQLQQGGRGDSNGSVFGGG